MNSGKVSRNLRGVVILSEITPSLMGVEFLKKVIDKMEQKIAESESWGYTLHQHHGEFKDDEEKNVRDAPLGRGRSGVGQYACVH